MKPKISSFIIYLVIFGIGLEFGILLTFWDYFRPNFFQISFVKIIELSIAVFLATYIPYVLNTKLANRAKKIELVYDLVEEFQDIIKEIFRVSYDYMAKGVKSAESENEIVRFFKAASMHFTMVLCLKEADRDKKILSFIPEFFGDDLRAQFFHFKSIVTGSAFGKKKPVYSAAELIDCENIFHNIMKELNVYKLQLFC